MWLRALVLLAVITTVLAAVINGQQNPPAPSAGDTSVVFSVSQTLIQIDAEVTDGKGHHVTDLTANDFEVVLDHKPQQITNVSYVALDSPDINKPALAGSGPVPSFVVRPQDVHRSMVLLVDDLSLSFESIYYVKRTLHQFIDRNMRPGDLFALWETGHFNSVFQQFTSDKRVLDAAIDSLKWDPSGAGLLTAFEDNPQDRGRSTAGSPGLGGMGRGSRMGGNDPGTRDEKSYLRASVAAGVFATMGELVDELRSVGGRKAIVLFSDGIDIVTVPNVNGISSIEEPYAQEALKEERELIDKANRSGAVFYAVNMRGLEYAAPGARTQALFNRGVGLQELTEPTGGFAVINSNGYLDALERIDDDQKGYYLIAFKAPAGIDTAASTSTPFLPLQVRVKRKDLHIRSRAGFFGETDDAAALKPTPVEQMRLSMSSLFNRSELRLRLTAFYARTTDGKAAVRNLIYLNANDIAFTTDPNGKHKARLHIMVTASGAGAKPLANIGRQIEMDDDDGQFQRLLHQGILLALDVPVPRPGAYQVRTSIEDDASKRIGSAGQYLDIPDLKRRHLALTTPLIDLASASLRDRFRDIPAALREFHAGNELTFVSVVETDKSLPSANQPQGEIALFRDGEAVLKSPVPVVPVQGQSVHALRGQLKLSDTLPPGQYYLKATATENSGKHPRTTSAWMDFEVLPHN